MVRRLFIAVLLLATQSWAGTSTPASSAPQSRAEYCAMVADVRNIVDLTSDSSNLMAFRNQGGLINGGVCWWHSLYQRSALYLTLYRPDLEKPDPERARAIVHLIAAGRRVVEVPGYSNFFEFSRDLEPVVQSKLEQWQLIDGFLKQEWIRGLSGRSSLPTGRLASRLRKVHNASEESGDILWTMLQLPGIESHSWLVLDTEYHAPNYDLHVLDSNYPRGSILARYRSGDRTIRSGVPYLGRNRELARFKRAAQAYCSGAAISTLGREIELAALDPLDNDLD